MAALPTPPQPITATESPRVTPPVLMAAPSPAITPHPTRPATWGLASGSTFTAWIASTRVSSAKAPIPSAGDSAVPSNMVIGCRAFLLAKQYQGRVGVIALDASAGETAEVVAEFAAKHGLTVPIALNASGTAADIFGTGRTTTTIVIDSQGVLRYCGQFGDKRHAYAADALEAVLAGEEVRVKKTRHKG